MTVNGGCQEQSPMLLVWLGERDRSNLSITEVLVSETHAK